MRSLFVLLFTLMINSSFAFDKANSHIFVFVSFSMPDSSIKGWLNEGKLVSAPLVIRGLVNNSFKETLNKVIEIAKDKEEGIILDPTLFKKFKIQKVPAVVVTNQTCNLVNLCDSSDYAVLYGDVHLDYALKKIAEENPKLQMYTKPALEILDKKNND